MTREEFAERWQHQHYPTMDLQAEVPFYYDIYQRICSVAKDGCKKINEFYVIQILMYVENMGHLKLDGVYAQLYRCSEDMVGHWCGLMELSAPTVNAVKMIVGEAIGKAPESGLVKWVQESVASHDFNELKSVALFFAHADLAVGLLFRTVITVKRCICSSLMRIAGLHLTWCPLILHSTGRIRKE